MKIIFNDLMQFSDLDDDLKSPSLDDRVENTGTIFVNFSIPADYSEFSSFDGVLSQPLSEYMATDFDGILSQSLSEFNSIDFDGVLSQPLTVQGSNELNCLGIGGTDATQIIINGDIVINSDDGKAFQSGLYEIGQTITASSITIDHNGTYMGRIAAGECRCLGIAPSREPGFYTSVKQRESLSGAVIPLH